MKKIIEPLVFKVSMSAPFFLHPLFFLSLTAVFLGIWADESGDEQEERPSFKAKKQPKSYTAPIGFVAGGVQQAGKKDKKESVRKEESDESDDERPSTSFKHKNSSSDSENETMPRTGRNYLSEKPFVSLCSFFLT